MDYIYVRMITTNKDRGWNAGEEGRIIKFFHDMAIILIANKLMEARLSDMLVVRTNPR